MFHKLVVVFNKIMINEKKDRLYLHQFHVECVAYLRFKVMRLILLCLF